MKDVVIEIRDPLVKSDAKLDQALDILEKAFGKKLKTRTEKDWTSKDLSKEISPYRSVRELEDRSKDRVEENLLELFNQIRTKWLGLKKADDDSKKFTIHGDTYINPKTGEPLTKGEWKKIRESVTKALGMIYEEEESRIVKTALALGKILRNMNVEDSIDAQLGNIRLTDERIDEELSEPGYWRMLQFAEQSTAEYITDLTNRQYKGIYSTIVEAQKNQWGTQKLEQELFYKFGEMNRDWQMIADTEIANNFNNGYLLAELDKAGDDENIFMKGVSAADACDWCKRNVSDQVVVLVQSPPNDGGTVEVNGVEYPAIWPGKTNVGRKKRDWWVAVPVHPMCRCTFVRHTPGFEKFDDMLKDAMDQAAVDWYAEHPEERENEEWRQQNEEAWKQEKLQELKAKRKEKA